MAEPRRKRRPPPPGRLAVLVAISALVALASFPSVVDSARLRQYPEPEATAPPFREDDYWVFADRLAAALDQKWNADRGAYESIGGTDTSIRFNIRYNAQL